MNEVRGKQIAIYLPLIMFIIRITYKKGKNKAFIE